MARSQPRMTPGPALAVCGWSGSGKTTLLEGVIAKLVERGLSVAAVKHDAHGLDVDRPGKDSDRLFRAGADVTVHGGNETLARRHGEADLAATVRGLLEDHDLVLVEGHKSTPLPKVWLAGRDDPQPPPGLQDVRAVLRWDENRVERLLDLIDGWLPAAWNEVPVLGGVLIGGASRRMGSPKHLLPVRGVTMAETVVAAVSPAVEGVVLLGAGAVPEALAGIPRLADARGAEGPLAGMLAALRWAPGNAWIFAGCDLPDASPAAAEWLLGRRAPGRWAVLPDCGQGLEPLLALYEPQARGPLEALAAAGRLAPRLLAEHPRVHVAAPPLELRRCWRNINTPEEFEAIGRPPGA